MNQKAFQALTLMFNAFPQSSADTKALLLTYDQVLRGVLDEAICEGVERFMGGVVPGQSKTFAPSIAEFSTEARRIAAEIEYGRRPALPKPAPDPWDLTPASERNRMRLKMPMLQFARANGKLLELHGLNERGAPFEEFVALAQTWGMTIPEEAWHELERQKRRAA